MRSALCGIGVDVNEETSALQSRSEGLFAAIKADSMNYAKETPPCLANGYLVVAGL